MSQSEWKAKGRALVNPLVNVLDKLGFSPDTVSVVGLLISIWAAWIAAHEHLFWGAVVLMVGSAFDMLDGDLARLQGRASRRGAFLDSNFDRLAESALFAGLMWFYAENYDSTGALFCILTLAGSLTTSYARARAEGLGTTCYGGWLQRPERMILVIVGMMLGAGVLKFVLGVLVIATWATTLQRIVTVMRDLEDAEPLEAPVVEEVEVVVEAEVESSPEDEVEPDA